MRAYPRSAASFLRTSVAVLVGSLFLGLTGCSDRPNPTYTDRAALESYLRQAPGVPLVLPTTLPEAYVFLGPGYEQSEGDRMFVRSTDYRLDAGSGSTVVEVCVAKPDRPRETCAPKGSEGQTLERRSGAYRVWIRPLGSDAFTEDQRAFWSAVPLSDDLDAVAWLT